MAPTVVITSAVATGAAPIASGLSVDRSETAPPRVPVPVRSFDVQPKFDAAIRAAVNARSLNSPAIRERLIDDYARGSTRARARDTSPTDAAGNEPGAVRPADESLTEALTGRELEVVAALAGSVRGRLVLTVD